MDRRGDLATILLFFAGLFLVVTSLFSFVSFKGDFAKDSEGRSGMLSDIAFYEQYIIKESEMVAGEVISTGNGIISDVDLKSRFKKISEKKNLGIIGVEVYFIRINEGQFGFRREDDNYVFEISDLNLMSSRGANSFSRNLSFKIEFDFKGDIFRIK